MKSAVVALAASVLLVVPTLALGAAPDAPAASGGGAGGGKGNKIKAAMEACKTEVTVKGPDRKKAVMDCVSREHPEFAGRMQCRQDGMAKGLSGDELKSFVKTCVKSSHG